MSEIPTLKILYHDDELERIVQKPNGCWIDLHAAEDVTLMPADYRKISLGISAKIPEGYEVHLAPRSSTFEKWKIIQVNSVGVIDTTFCGPNDIWQFPALAMMPTTIHKNDRICQFRLMPVQGGVNLEEVYHLDDPDRGGFGSTGTN